MTASEDRNNFCPHETIQQATVVSKAAELRRGRWWHRLWPWCGYINVLLEDILGFKRAMKAKDSLLEGLNYMKQERRFDLKKLVDINNAQDKTIKEQRGAFQRTLARLNTGWVNERTLCAMMDVNISYISTRRHRFNESLVNKDNESIQPAYPPNETLQRLAEFPVVYVQSGTSYWYYIPDVMRYLRSCSAKYQRINDEICTTEDELLTKLIESQRQAAA